MTKQSELPTKLWIRREDLRDMMNVGVGAQCDLFCEYSNSLIITGMEAYIPEQELIDLRTRMQAEVERARAKSARHLEEWVSHDIGCNIFHTNNDRRKCDCGLEFAFAEIADLETKASRAAEGGGHE